MKPTLLVLTVLAMLMTLLLAPLKVAIPTLILLMAILVVLIKTTRI